MLHVRVCVVSSHTHYGLVWGDEGGGEKTGRLIGQRGGGDTN